MQGYETLALYRDVLVPEGRARELAAAALSAGARAPKNGGATSISPPPARDERMWESMSRAEDGVTVSEVIGSPVRRHPTTANGVDIQDEVDKDFDELVAVKAREELEELYGFPAIVSFRITLERTISCLWLTTTHPEARSRVCVVFAPYCVDIAFPRICLVAVGRVPRFARFGNE